MFDLDLIILLKICAVGIVPTMVIVIWLLSKIVNSKKSVKIATGAIIVALFMAVIVFLITNGAG
ncbi:MAG: hypothetical protein GY943_29845 [Chloroflexi bacterium]|nr:hypothetical protein [Chloroflexota bacterium]